LLSLEYRRTTIGIWAIYLLSWIAWFLLLLWLPTALTTLALKKSTAALGTVTVNGAFIIMAIPLSTLLPKLDPRVLLLAMFASGVVIAIMVGLSGANWTLLFILIALAGFGIGGQQLVLNYLIAEAYPTQLRATATVWSIGIGRLGSIVGSALGGFLLTGLGVSGYFMSRAVPLALAAVATLMVRHHKGGYQPSFTAEATPGPQLESHWPEEFTTNRGGTAVAAQRRGRLGRTVLMLVLFCAGPNGCRYSQLRLRVSMVNTRTIPATAPSVSRAN